jgi:co-chaperonin GroES (HSP10)
MNIQPLKNRILVREIPAAALDVGGIVIPESAHRGPRTAVIVALGPKCVLPLSPGDRVLLPAHAAGVPIRVGKDDFRMIEETDIPGIIE